MYLELYVAYENCCKNRKALLFLSTCLLLKEVKFDQGKDNFNFLSPQAVASRLPARPPSVNTTDPGLVFRIIWIGRWSCWYRRSEKRLLYRPSSLIISNRSQEASHREKPESKGKLYDQYN
jgi:hypothetical protein